MKTTFTTQKTIGLSLQVRVQPESMIDFAVPHNKKNNTSLTQTPTAFASA